ncbi:hypothetical protein [Ulvibacterium marinum]|uniref:hypothetical protein n=1 Tax=Ulvibacterium marinum TaxID=2419782 RepID=UPI0013145979|nr:hypothetical protein [Ulvibacterium marinum]
MRKSLKNSVVFVGLRPDETLMNTKVFVLSILHQKSYIEDDFPYLEYRFTDIELQRL